MKKILLTLILISLAYFIKAQDTHFSQYNQTPLLINPAMTGSGLGIHRAGLNYREQGTFFTQGYLTYCAFYDGKYSFRKRSIKNYHQKMNYFGLGVFFTNDRAGDSKMGTANAGISVSYFMALMEKHKFSVGFQGSFVQRSIDFTNLTWDSQYTNNSYNEYLPPEFISTEENFAYPDISTGITWQYRKDRYFKFITGISLHHVNSIELKYLENGNEILDRKMIAHGELEYMTDNTVFTLIPSFIYKRQGKLQEGTFGTLLKYQINEANRSSKFLENYLGIGLYNRYNDAFITSIVLSWKNTRVGFNYDINYSSLRRASNYKGAIEASVIFHIPYESRKGSNSLI